MFLGKFILIWFLQTSKKEKQKLQEHLWEKWSYGNSQWNAVFILWLWLLAEAIADVYF